MPGWNIADVFEVVAATVPTSPALIQGGRVRSWRELDHRAGQVAAFLAARGLVRQDKVVQYLRQSPEYLETLAATIERPRASVRGVLAWLWVDGGSGPCPPWAVPYESAAAPATSRPEPHWERDGDDIVLLYTGGTTGLPKGVIWRQDDLMVSLGNAAGGRYPGP